MKKQIIALFLLFVMLLTAAACAKQSDTTNLSTDSSLSDINTSAEETQPEISDGLPERDLEGWEMRVSAHHDSLSDESTIYASEMNGEVINDIIYTRNVGLENRFNFKYTVIPGNGWANDYSKLKTSVLAGSHDYDMAFLLPFAAGGATVLDGCLYNMLAVPYLNFDQPWWHTNVNELFTYNGYLPFVSSDYLLSSYQYANILIFNKVMAENYNLENIYDLVRGGKWTLDKFGEICAKVSRDINGDSVFDKNDQYGLATNFGYHAITWGYAIGEVSIKLAQDEVILGYQNERFYNLCNWLYDLLYVSGNAFEIGWDKECDISWDENRVFIQALWLSDLEKFRGYDSEYGIIPYPKYQEEQSMYHTYVDARCGGIAVPMDIDAETLEKVGLIIEALSCDSYKNLIPAYLESVTNNKYTRDNDSIEMLEYIAAGRIWDIGYTMAGTDSYTWAIFTSLKKSGGQIASTLEKNTSKTINYYDKIITAYKKLSELNWN